MSEKEFLRRRLILDCETASKVMANTGVFPTGQDILKDCAAFLAALPPAQPDAVEALVKAAAKDAREVFEDYGSKAREAIDYMEQVALAAIRGEQA